MRIYLIFLLGALLCMGCGASKGGRTSRTPPAGLMELPYHPKAEARQRAGTATGGKPGNAGKDEAQEQKETVYAKFVPIYKPAVRPALIVPEYVEPSPIFRHMNYFPVYFGINSSEPDSADLSKIRQEVGRFLEEIETSGGTNCTILIWGQSSPDGLRWKNNTLAAARAQTVKNYIQHWFALPDSVFSVESGTATLSDLNNAFGWYYDIPEGSGLTPAQEIYDYIHETYGPLRAEGKLPHESRIIADIRARYPIETTQYAFKRLRNAGIMGSYQITEYPPAEIYKQVVLQLDGLMKLTALEYYTAAAHYGEDSDKWHTIIKACLMAYPYDYVPIINYSASRILSVTRSQETKSLPSVKNLLHTTRERTPHWYNNYACYLILAGELDEAVRQLDMAEAAGGCPEVAHNREEIEKKRLNITLRKQYEDTIDNAGGRRVVHEIKL